MSSHLIAPNAYKESAVLTAPPERLVVMLYDGARRFLTQGSAAMTGGDLATANERLQRGEAILDELLATLDLSAGEVAERLQAIYLFCLRRLNEARLARDPAMIGDVCGLLGELREAWAQIAPAP